MIIEPVSILNKMFIIFTWKKQTFKRSLRTLSPLIFYVYLKYNLNQKNILVINHINILPSKYDKKNNVLAWSRYESILQLFLQVCKKRDVTISLLSKLSKDVSLYKIDWHFKGVIHSERMVRYQNIHKRMKKNNIAYKGFQCSSPKQNIIYATQEELMSNRMQKS